MDALALRVVSDARWPPGTTFRLVVGRDLRIGHDFDSDIPIGAMSTPVFAQRKARVTATPAGGFEIRSDSIGNEIFVDEVRTYRRALVRGQGIRLGDSRFEVIDAVLDAASSRGCSACGTPLDFLSRPIPGRTNCAGCRAVIRIQDGVLELTGAVRMRLDETLRRAVEEGSVDAWAETVRTDSTLPDWFLETDDVIAAAKPWLDGFHGQVGVLLQDAPLEVPAGMLRPPHLCFRENAPGTGAVWLEWVAKGAGLRVEHALVRWLVVRIPVADLRGPGNRKIRRASSAPGLAARCPWSLLRVARR